METFQNYSGSTEVADKSELPKLSNRPKAGLLNAAVDPTM